MKAVWRDEVIAESAGTVTAKGYIYFPRAAVRMDMLRQSPKTESDLACPHGVQVYDIVTAGGRSDRAL
jgi:uncharacterized protein (DUF427 family)